MKLRKVTIRPINKKTGLLPEDTSEQWLVLLRQEKGKRVAQHLFFNHACHGVWILDYTHYIALPNYLTP